MLHQIAENAMKSDIHLADPPPPLMIFFVNFLLDLGDGFPNFKYNESNSWVYLFYVGQI